MATEQSDADKIVAAIESLESGIRLGLERIEDNIQGVAMALWDLAPKPPEEEGV